MKSIFLLVLTLGIVTSVEADTFRCGSRIVSIGDSMGEVLITCGEPADRNRYQEEIKEVERKSAEKDANHPATNRILRTITVTTEEWTYDQGPDSFVRILKFVDGRLKDIREAGYGPTGRKADNPCELILPSKGSSQADVRARCGQPQWTHSRKEEVIEDIDDQKSRSIVVAIEEWTYNFGPNRFVRILEFRNGKLVDTRTGGYGY